MHLQTVQGVQLLLNAQVTNQSELNSNVQELVQISITQQDTIKELAKEKLLHNEEMAKLKLQMQEMNQQFNGMVQRLGEENKALQDRINLISEAQKRTEKEMFQLKTAHEDLQKRYLNHNHPAQSFQEVTNVVKAVIIGKPVDLS